LAGSWYARLNDFYLLSSGDSISKIGCQFSSASAVDFASGACGWQLASHGRIQEFNTNAG
jgi:hypothetical protein